MIYPNNFEQKTGFAQIRELVAAGCLSPLGAEKAAQMQFTTSFADIQFFLQTTNEFKQICLFSDTFPTSHYFDVTPSLKKIRIEGMFLDVQELFDFKRSLESIKAILQFFKASKEDEYIHLKQLTGNVTVYPFVIDKIDAIITKTGQIKDNASPALLEIRKSLKQKENEISRITNSILKKAQSEGWVDSDVSLTIRDGRALIPVSSTHKRKIKGLVYDESATGKTSFIEPLETIEINNEIRELEFAERLEIIKILIEFCDAIRPYLDDLLNAYDFLGEIDFIRAKAKFALQVNASMPNISPDVILDFRTAIHPLLFLSLKKEGKKVVPLDIELNSKQRIVLISGPNAGGKSVCLKTVGLLQYMLQSGLLIPVSENSTAGIFSGIFIDIGDDQSIENDLSTYSSHLLHMNNFLQHADNKSLILIDEFGAGTEPLSGGAIAESILEQLNSKNTFGVVTTHYTNLKHFAAETQGIVNAAMLYDTGQLQPLFQLQIGIPGSSFAFEIAAKTGLPQSVLKKAADLTGQKHIEFDKHLQDIERERRQIADLRKSLSQKEAHLDKLVAHFQKEVDHTLSQRKTIFNEAKEKAKEIVTQANKKIENTISEIKRVNAEKEQTREIRKEFEKFRDDMLLKINEEEKKINEKIDHLKKKQSEREKRKQGKEQKKPEKIVVEEKQTTFQAGDKVKLKDQEAVCTVLRVKDEDITISFGLMKTVVKAENLKKVGKNEAKRLEKEHTPRTQMYYSKNDIEFKPVLDLRGKRMEEAIDLLNRYIDDAIVMYVHQIKILHGTGNGILKQGIRNYLKTNEIVKTFRDEIIQLGGAGITIADLEY